MVRDRQAEASSAADAKPPVAPSLGGFLLAWTVVFGLALASPFLAGFEGIMGIVILGIALYEAWKLNRRVAVSGPFRSSSAVPATDASTA